MAVTDVTLGDPYVVVDDASPPNILQSGIAVAKRELIGGSKFATIRYKDDNGSMWADEFEYEYLNEP